MAKRICLGCMNGYDDRVKVCPFCGYVDGTGPKEAYHIVPGTILQGKYIVGRSIGYGGFGITYIGYDYALARKIAIKEYMPGEFCTRCAGDTKVTVFEGEQEEQFKGGIEKYIDEARRLAKFKGLDGVVTIYDSFKENDTAYIIMEYLEGRTLKEVLQEEGKMDFEKAMEYIVPILDALTEIHKDGLLHRDISPDNIFVTNDGQVKLIDFGAARYATTAHSKSLSLIVKPGYAPQEQYRSRGDQGPWTDVYACAATLYKMITGITPEDSMERGNKDTLKDPRSLGISIAKNKQNAIMNALNLKIEDRTQTPEEFKNELLSETWVQRKKNTMKKMDIGRWPLWVKISAGVGAAAVCTAIILLLTGVISFHFENGRLKFMVGDGKTIVPDVVNYSVEEAQSIAERQKMSLNVDSAEEGDDIVAGIIIHQLARAGSEVEQGDVLFVQVSKGSGFVIMDNYVGREEGETKAALEGNRLPYITERGESEIAPGFVFEQSIEPGVSVEKGSEVRIKVSEGIASYDPGKGTQVPQLVGLSFDDGRKEVRNKHLYIKVIGQEYSYDKPAGQIFEQDIAAGTETKEGEIVGVKISLGIEKHLVPDVRYEYAADAKAALEAEGFTVKIVEEESSTVPEGKVIRQSPEGGTEIELTQDGKLTEITIYVSTGNPEDGEDKPIPNLIGRTEAEAKNILSSLGYRVGKVSYQKGKSKSKDGTVVSQNPGVGKRVAAGTSVDITVYQYVDDTTAGGDDVVDDRVQVPNVTGMKYEEARKKLVEVGLSVQRLSYQTGNDKKRDLEVVDQNVRAGSKVDKGTVVGLTIYKYEDGSNVTPDDQVQVILLIGKTEKEAEDALAQAGLKVGKKYTEKGNDSGKDGTVVDQNPAKSTKVKKGSSVDFTIYKYEERRDDPVVEMVSVPSVINKSQKDAETALVKVGLKTGTITKEIGNDSSKNGLITAQAPTSGEKVHKGTVVNLTVYEYSEPDQPISVPKLVGLSETDAKSALASANLKCGNITRKSDKSSSTGKVLSQSYKSGSSVDKGTTVDLVVCDNTTKTYYSYQDVTSTSKKTTSSSTAPATGYKLVDTKTEKVETGMGEWGEWSESRGSGDEEDKKVQYLVGRYYHESDYEASGSSVYGGYGCTASESHWYDKDYLEPRSQGTKYIGEYGCNITTYWIRDNISFIHSWGSGGPWHEERTLYRYKNKTYNTVTTYYWEKPNYSSWSNWSTTSYTKSSTRRVAKKTIYWDEDINQYKQDDYVQ